MADPPSESGAEMYVAIAELLITERLRKGAEGTSAKIATKIFV